MATRDRTSLFLRYREEARALHRPPAQSTSFSSDFDYAPPTDSLLKSDTPSSPSTVRRAAMLPEYHFLYNDLNAHLADVRALLAQLSNMFATHVLPSFADTDKSELHHQIRTYSLRLTDMLRDAQKKVAAIVPSQPPPQRSSETPDDAEKHRLRFERQICINMQKRFANPLQELSLTFRRKQTAYMTKLKELQHATPSTTVETNTTLPTFTLDDDSRPLGSDSFSDVQIMSVENASVIAQQRNRELDRVAANVSDLATLVNDIASLVVHQGTVLDRIDYNLETVDRTTFDAVKQLRIADRHQRKRHALCCIIILALACAVMFTILVFKWTS